MPRRREVPKREILPDPKFGNVELSKFMNVIMEGGKKAVAERIIYGALDLIQKKHPDKDPLEAFVVAINNVKPDRKSTRLNSSHLVISYAVFCLKKKKTITAYTSTDMTTDPTLPGRIDTTQRTQPLDSTADRPRPEALASAIVELRTAERGPRCS